MALNREGFLALAQCKSEEVEVDGQTVLVRELTARERDDFEASCIKRQGKDVQINLKNIRAKLVTKTAINSDTGERMFTDAEEELVGKLPASIIDKLFSTAQRLSGITKEDVEELAKNFESAPLEDSSTD